MAKNNSIKATVSPLYARLVKAEAVCNGISQSRIISESIKRRYDTMPLEQKQELLRSFDKSGTSRNRY